MPALGKEVEVSTAPLQSTRATTCVAQVAVVPTRQPLHVKTRYRPQPLRWRSRNARGPGGTVPVHGQCPGLATSADPGRDTLGVTAVRKPRPPAL